MSSSLPSFTFVATDDEIPAQRESCWDFGDLVQQKVDAGEAWSIMTRGPWHLYILDKIRELYPAPALEYLYLYKEVSIFKGTELDSALEDIRAVRKFFMDNFLSDSYSFSLLFKDDLKPDRSYEKLLEIARTARAQKDIAAYHSGPDIEKFSSFLLSQQQVLADAATAGENLVHVQFYG